MECGNLATPPRGFGAFIKPKQWLGSTSRTTISLADLVAIPVQGSQLDARQAARQIALIRAQEKVLKRTIPFAVLLPRTNPALNPRTLRHIEERMSHVQQTAA